ncbi:MAG: hypothetical protein ACOXZK_11470 [Bacteroidales bacterium]|jgi:hypothetical protein
MIKREKIMEKIKAFFQKVKNAPLFKFIYLLLAIILSLPLAFYINQYTPALFFRSLQIEIILIYFGLLIILYLIFKLFRTASIIGVVIISFLISYKLITANKSEYKKAKKTYLNLVEGFTDKDGVKNVDIITNAKATKPHASFQQRLLNKVDYKDTMVRNFAVEKSLLYFDDYYTKYNYICREFSLIKYIKNNFKYVRDPKGFDYFATPQETIRHMGGDCDDHTILMGSTIKAIGGNVRFILTTGHIYPELYCGNAKNFDKYVSAIRNLFYDESYDKTIYYRIENDEYWLNIDYTDKYPGSFYYSDTVISIFYP